MSRRLSLQEGFERLLPCYASHVICEKFNRAWRVNQLRLFCNGKLLTPSYISSNLLAVAEQEDDGRWRCIVVPHGARLGFNPSHPYVWEVDAEGIAALRPAPAKKRGRKAVQNWTEIVDHELLHLRYNGSPLLENFEQLCAHLMGRLQDEGSSPPKNLKRFRQRIRAFLGVQN
jgi:hypothetical protein